MLRTGIRGAILLPSQLELRGIPMVAGGGSWCAIWAVSKVARNVGNIGTTRGGVQNKYSLEGGYTIPPAVRLSQLANV